MISRTDYSKMSGSPGSMGCFDQYLSSMCWEELAKELSQLVNPPSCDHHCSNRPSFRQKNKMKPTNPNAHTYVNGTDVETHGYAVTHKIFLQ